MALARTSHLVTSNAVITDAAARKSQRRTLRGSTGAPAIDAPRSSAPESGTATSTTTGTAAAVLGMPLPLGMPLALATPVGRLRRCTFRRIDLVTSGGRGVLAAYEAMCLYGDRDAPTSLGGLAQAEPVCTACSATGIFRPDED